MKKKLWLLLILCCQGMISIAQRATYIGINGNILPIEHLIIQDSLSAGRIEHTAAFSLPLQDHASLQYILTALQRSSATVSIFYTGANSVTTERQYRSPATVQFQLSRLDATGRSNLKAEIRIRSSAVEEKINTTFIYKNPGNRPILASNFALVIEKMPTTYVQSITGLELKNNGLLSFEVSVREIESWKQWFANAKKLNGSIFLLAPNMRDKLKEIKLVDLELICITQSILTNDDRTERFKAVVKVGAVSFFDVK